MTLWLGALSLLSTVLIVFITDGSLGGGIVASVLGAGGLTGVTHAFLQSSELTEDKKIRLTEDPSDGEETADETTTPSSA